MKNCLMSWMQKRKSADRGAPSEVLVGIEEGLKHDLARLALISPEKMKAVCRALSIATDA
jgi:hypothetical protein